MARTTINKFSLTNNKIQLTHLATIGSCTVFYRKPSFSAYKEHCFLIGRHTDINYKNQTCTWQAGLYDLTIDSLFECLLEREYSFKLECDKLGIDNMKELFLLSISNL